MVGESAVLGQPSRTIIVFVSSTVIQHEKKCMYTNLHKNEVMFLTHILYDTEVYTLNIQKEHF